MQIIKDALLQKHITNGKVAPSYLLIDKDLIKLREIATWFCKALKLNNADCFWLTAEQDADSIQVKGTEAFIEKANLAAVGERKLLIICDTSTMTIGAQNKILKTLEDAIAENHFLLLASNSETVLNTIKSRCVIIYPEPLTPSQVIEKYPDMPTEFCDGTLNGAAQFTGNINSSSIYRNVEQLLFKAQALDDALPLVPLLIAKDNFNLTLSAFNFYLGKLLHAAESGRWTIERVNVILKQLAIINRNIAANCNAQNAFDLLLIKLFN